MFHGLRSAIWRSVDDIRLLRHGTGTTQADLSLVWLYLLLERCLRSFRFHPCIWLAVSHDYMHSRLNTIRVNLSKTLVYIEGIRFAMGEAHESNNGDAVLENLVKLVPSPLEKKDESEGVKSQR